MKFEAVLHEAGHSTPLFRCHVVASDTGDAMKKIKKHLQDSGLENLTKHPIYLVDIGISIEPDVLLIE
jgi:arylamine N-acetyltransferase